MHFAKTARPLYKLFKVEIEVEGEDCNFSQVRYWAQKSKASIQEQWNPQCEKAFHHLTRSLTEARVLSCAYPAKPYKLHVDASRKGLGRVLYQEQDGVSKVNPV